MEMWFFEETGTLNVYKNDRLIHSDYGPLSYLEEQSSEIMARYSEQGIYDVYTEIRLNQDSDDVLDYTDPEVNRQLTRMC